MSSTPNIKLNVGKAEKTFREAFERLKLGRTERVPKCTAISQNNVAKEAGCDPSALRKSRYPVLINEIQQWIKQHTSVSPQSTYQLTVVRRKQNRTLKEKIIELKAQRDHVSSLLTEANSKILDLTNELSRFQNTAKIFQFDLNR
jgi:hypothetical protein